jgi:hypothetical protein
VTGWSAGQSIEWIAGNADGWFQYLVPGDRLKELVHQWQAQCLKLSGRRKPLLQGAFLDLCSDSGALQTDFEQGFRGGRQALIDWLFQAQSSGINHIAFNLKRGVRSPEAVAEEVAEHVAPLFKRANSAVNVGMKRT